MQQEDNNSQDWGNVDERTSKKYAVNVLEITKENKWFYLLVVIFLGSTTVITAIGTIILSLFDKTIPSALVAIGATAVGALGGLFMKNS